VYGATTAESQPTTHAYVAAAAAPSTVTAPCTVTAPSTTHVYTGLAGLAGVSIAAPDASRSIWVEP
jgi:hypothetical protein